jgi:hypothetical protein
VKASNRPPKIAVTLPSGSVSFRRSVVIIGSRPSPRARPRRYRRHPAGQ